MPKIDRSAFDEIPNKNMTLLRGGQPPAAPVLFVHIPKTAGTALFALAAKVYGRIPGHLGPKILRLPMNWAEFEDRADVGALLAQCDDRRISFVSGHCSHRIRDLLPFDPITISLLRQPVFRVVSAYDNMRRDPINDFHETAKRMSLREILEQRMMPELENGQVRRIAGLAPDIGPLNREHLEVAKRNIDQDYSVVGLTERFDETVELLRIHLHWPRKGYMPWNIAPKKIAGTKLSTEMLELIENRNKLDVHLYEYATQRFDRQIASLQPEFDISVRRTRRYNQRVYRHWHNWAARPFRNLKRALRRRQWGEGKL